MRKIMMPIPSVKTATVLAALAGLATAMYITWRLYMVEPTIIPWSPGTAENPTNIVCFAALKGRNIQALSCIDSSVPAPLNTTQ